MVTSLQTTRVLKKKINLFEVSFHVMGDAHPEALKNDLEWLSAAR